MMPMVLNTLIIGLPGKMGNAILDEVITSYNDKINPVFGIARKNSTHRGIPVYTFEECSDQLEKSEKGIEAIIDFSSPEALSRAVDLAKNYEIPFIVSGTTGLGVEQLENIRKEIENSKISMVWSPNFSPLVNLQIALVGLAAKKLIPMGYDIGIIDEHHSMKKDSPSGTTKKIIAEITKNTNIREVNYWKEEFRPKNKNSLDVAVLRIGGTVGLHDVRIIGQNGRLKIETLMYSRKDFAKGALESLLWLKQHGKKGNLYSFNEVLGI